MSKGNVYWLHSDACPCTACRVERTAAAEIDLVEPEGNSDDQLGFGHFAYLTLVAVIIGHAVAFVCNPLGTIEITRELWSFRW